MSASRARSLPIARRPWPLLAATATVVGVWTGVQAPAVSPVSPAMPIAQESMAEPVGVDDPSGATDGDRYRDGTRTGSFDSGARGAGPDGRDGRGGRGRGAR
jgi:hypothetical protein